MLSIWSGLNFVVWEWVKLSMPSVADTLKCDCMHLYISGGYFHLRMYMHVHPLLVILMFGFTHKKSAPGRIKP